MSLCTRVGVALCRALGATCASRAFIFHLAWQNWSERSHERHPTCAQRPGHPLRGSDAHLSRPPLLTVVDLPGTLQGTAVHLSDERSGSGTPGPTSGAGSGAEVRERSRGAFLGPSSPPRVPAGPALFSQGIPWLASHAPVHQPVFLAALAPWRRLRVVCRGMESAHRRIGPRSWHK